MRANTLMKLLRRVGEPVKRLSFNLVLALVVLQLALPQAAVLAAPPEDSSPMPLRGDSDPEIQNADPHLLEVDNYFQRLTAKGEITNPSGGALFDGPQTLEVYDAIGEEDRVIAQHSLSAIDTAREKVVFFANEIEVFYDATRRRLEFQRWVFDKKLNRRKKTHAHIFGGVQLTGEVEKVVARDKNVTLISTSHHGVLGGLTQVLMSGLFNTFIPLTTFYPAASVAGQGAQIVSLEFVNPESSPRETRDADNGITLKYGEKDLVIEIASGEQTQSVRFDYRKDVNARLKVHTLMVLYLLQAASPDLELIPQIQEITQKNREALLPLQKKLETLALQDPGGLSLATLRSTAHSIELGKMAGLLKPNNRGQDAFERLAQDHTYEWLADDWRRLHAKIEESRRYEKLEAARHGLPENRIQRTWAEVLASNLANPEKSVADTVAEIAKHRADASSSLTQDLISLARKQLTPAKLTILGMAVAGDLTNQATGGKVTGALFSVVSNLFGWSTQTWGIRSLVLETAEHSANYLQPFAFTSVVALLGTLLLFQPVSYILAKTVAIIRDEKNEDGTHWTSAQAFFSYGGRVYAHLTYPVQLFLWKLLGQKNVTTALENGGGISTPGALHLPFVASAAEKAKEKMTRHLDQVALRKQRAMLIAALAVSEVLKSEGKHIDPPTLLMLLSAHEAGKLSEFNRLLTELPPNAEWEKIAAYVYKDLTALHDDGVGELDAQSINGYSQAMAKAVSHLVKMNTPAEGLAGCLAKGATASCQWIGQKARQFGAWTSSIGGWLATGGASYHFYKRFRGFRVSPNDVKVADHQMRYDYAGSEIMAAATDSQRFPVAFQVGHHLDKLLASIADAAEQVGIYGAQGGVEIAMINQGELSSLAKPSPTVSSLAYRRDHLDYVPPGEDRNEYQLGRGKQDSVLHSIGTAGATLLDPEQGLPKVFHTHLRRMDATVQAIQGKGLLGYLPRVAALIMISLVAAAQSDSGLSSWELQEVLSASGSGLLKQANVLFNKLSLVYGAGGLAAGYALIWAPVIWLQNTLENRVKDSRDQLVAADHFLEQGLRNDEAEQIQDGVAILLTLYDKSGTALPSQFELAPNLYTWELARELAEYAQAHPPVATVINQKVSMFNNIAIGALISTVLALTLSHDMYDPKLEILPQLTTSLMAFTATYFGVKLIGPHAGKPIQFVKSCAAAILGKTKPTE